MDERVADTPEAQRLTSAMDRVKTWLTATDGLQAEMHMDMGYAKTTAQWSAADKAKMARKKMATLTMDELSPQIDLLRGIQESEQGRWIGTARGVEDRRYSEIASSLLRATEQATNIDEVDGRVFTQGIITGLSGWEVRHGFDDAEDWVHGDVRVNHIEYGDLVFDPLATDELRQQGEFLGSWWWMTESGWELRYPGIPFPKDPGAHGFIAKAKHWLSLSGVGHVEISPETFFDKTYRRVRVCRLWHKEAKPLHFIVDTRTAETKAFSSKAAASDFLDQIKEGIGQAAIARYAIQEGTTETVLLDVETGQVAMDPESLEPLRFADKQGAQAKAAELATQAGRLFNTRFEAITRKLRVPHFTEFTWDQVMKFGKTPYDHLFYPIVPYVATQYCSDPLAIRGIVRTNRDRQDEINKQRSLMMEHLTTTVNGGWHNRKALGADTEQLQNLGSMAHAVIENNGVQPTRIEPPRVPDIHLALISTATEGIRRNTGLNQEAQGLPGQTISGRAIERRQQGGVTINRPRLSAFARGQRMVRRQMLMLAQQYYPEEKIHRLVASDQLRHETPGASSAYLHPATGEPATDAEIIRLLKNMKVLTYDLALEQAPFSVTERQAKLQIAVEVLELLTATGRPIQPKVIETLIDMGDFPSRFVAAVKESLNEQGDPNDPAVQAQHEQLKGLLGQMSAGQVSDATG